MAGERQIVTEIRSFLDSGVLPPHQTLRDMAERYAELCADVNRRLGQCELYLNRDMRTEAIHLAETPPPVLDSAAELHFQGVEAWRKHCHDNDLPAPTPIASAVVSRLNHAYVKEDSLATLMTEHRRLVHQGTLAQQVSALRRILRLDEENEHWAGDLANLERARLGELASEVREAIAAENAERMELLRSELGSSDWSVTPPPELSEQLSECMAQMRRKAARKVARKITRRMAHGYGALDYALTKRCSLQWQALLSTGDLVPSSELAEQVAEAEEWLKEQEDKRSQDRDFENALRTLVTVLDRRVSLAELERHVYAVSKHSREIPEALRERIERALADARLAERRQFRMRIFAVGAVVLAVAIPLLLFAIEIAARRVRVQWLSRIDAAREEQDFDSAQVLLHELKTRRPKLYAEADFQDRATRVEQEAREFAMMRREFPRIMQQLETIRDAGFPPQSPVSGLVEVAREYAYTSDEKIRFQNWFAAFQSHEAKTAKEANDRFTGLLTRITERFKRLDTLNPELDYETFQGLLMEVRKDFEGARAIEGVSYALQGQLDDLNKRSVTLFASLDKAKERVARKAELLGQLDRVPADMAAYERVLTALLAEFPTHPEVAEWKRMQGECRRGMDLLRSKAWSADDRNELSKQAAAFLASPEAATSVWRDSMQWVVGSEALSGSAANVVTAIEALKSKGNWRFYDLKSFTARSRRSTGDQEPVRYYYRAPPERNLQAAIGDREEYRYTVNVFGKEDEEKAQSFSTLAFVLAISMSADKALAPHCRFLRRVVPEIQQADPAALAGVLLLRSEELRTMSEVDPIVKVILLQNLLKSAEKMTSAHQNVLKKAIEVLDGCNTNVYWMDPEPDDATLTAKRDTATILEKLDALAPLAFELVLQSGVYEESLRRKPQFVGMLMSGQGTVEMRFTDDSSQEVWIVTPDRSGSTTVSLLAERDAEGVCRVLPEMKGQMLAGRPLFAPGDNRRTRDILRRLVGRLPGPWETQLKAVSWPRSWPVNARSFGGPRGETDVQR